MASAVRMVSAQAATPHGDRDDLGGDALFLQADGFLDGDLVERVHRHLDAGGLDAGAVGLDADLDVVIDHPLDRDEDFHVVPCRLQDMCGALAAPGPGDRQTTPVRTCGTL